MRTAEIYVFDKFAGNLVEDDYGTFTFQYDVAYLEDSLPVAVSCTMPLRKEPYASTSLFPFFDGLIPEGWLLGIAEKNWKLDSRDRMGLLLACCSSSIGAVRVLQAGDSKSVAGERKLTVGKDLFKSEFEFPYSDDEINEMARNLVASRISVSGVQPKLSVHLERDDGGSSRITIVGFEGDYILKLPSNEYPCLIESEAAAMTLAGKCGIRTAQFSLARLSGGHRAYVTKRMDRNPQIKHMEDFCQLTERLTERKYFGSYEQIAKKIRLYSSTGGADVIRFFEVVLYSFLIGNSDMHLKNFSLLREDNSAWHLADAYDLLPVKLLLPEDSEDMALTLNGKKAKIGRNDFVEFGGTIGLNERQVSRAVSRIIDALAANIESVLAESQLTDEFADRFNKHVKRNIEKMC